MITAEDAIKLCSDLSKHRKYLEDQVKRHDYLDSKFKNRNDNSYSIQSQAYENALDNLNSLIGEMA